MNPHKKLARAIDHLASNPNDYRKASKHTAAAVKRAYEALVEVVEREQSFRLNAVFERTNKPLFPSVASISKTALAGHKGWAYRALDMADYVLNTNTTDLENNKSISYELSYAKDWLVENRYRFAEPTKDSVLHRGWAVSTNYLTKKLRGPYHFAKSLVNRFTHKEIPESDFDDFVRNYADVSQTRVKFGEELRKSGVSAVDLLEKGGPVSLKPEEEGFNGVKKWACETCRDDSRKWVWGARWGSEDYPCPKCNNEEYLKWCKENDVEP